MRIQTSTIALAACFITAMPAAAQERPADAVNAGERTGDLPEDVVVTGEKISRSIQDTPTSVRVITSQQIEQENLVSLYDAIDRTANLTSTFDRSGFTIRGIANSNVTGVGTGDLATVYLDGSPLPRGALSGPLDLWDLDQVEILRGPQSTLQGRNALAGAVIMRTTDPSFEWSGKARAILTDVDKERRFAAAIGGPIIADQLAFRIAGEHSRNAGLIDNVTLGDERAGFQDGDNIRAKLLFTPTALPDLRVVGSFFHDVHRNGVTYSFGAEPDAWSDRITRGNRPTIDRTASNIATLDIGYKLSSAFHLSSVSTYSRIVNSTRYDGDNTAADEAYGDLRQDQKTFTQEVRLSLESGPVTGLIGGYYSRYDDPEDRSHSVFSLSPIEDLGLPDAVSSFYPARLYIDTNQFYPQTITTAAIFGDATWQVAPRLKLHGGFRYDNERQRRANDNSVVLVTTLPDPASFGEFGPTIAYVNGLIGDQVTAATASSPAARTKFEAFLPKAGITYDVADDVSLSATAQRGYRSGGSGVNPGRGALYTYKPEYTWNYEVALRSQWLNHRLSINANAFYIDWKNQQVNVQLSSNIYDYETQNAGSSRVYGFELETRYQPSRAINVYASAGYSNTRFEQFIVTSGVADDLSGHEFPNAPHWTLAAGGTWESARGWFVNLNANYRSAAYQEVIDQATRQLRPHALVNAKLGWKNEHFGAYVTASNLFDQHYFDYSYFDGHQIESLQGQPRTIGVTLEARF